MVRHAIHTTWTLAASLCLACAGPGEGDHGAAPQPTGHASGIGLSVSDGETIGSDGSSGSGADTTTGPPIYPDLPSSTCETLQLRGESVVKPVDIVFAIDTSGSMVQEAAWVVDNMNAFSAQIVASGVDARVVLIAAPTMCIMPPLGSGQCGDASDSTDRYLHIAQIVGSTDALHRILDSADAWYDFLRPAAAKHIVVVSDDNAKMKADEFFYKLGSLLPGTGGFTFHAIASSLDPNSSECQADTQCCDLTAEEGTVYLQLIAKTGGVFGDLCDQDFAPVFSALAAHIVEAAPIGCTWTLPADAEDEFDYAAIDVRYALDGVLFTPMTQASGPAACPSNAPAWYFDDPHDPTQLTACPWTCQQLSAAPAANVEIDLPCLPPDVG